MQKIKNFFHTIKNKTSQYLVKTFSSKKDTFFFLAAILLVLIAIPITITAINKTFLHFNTDDVLQYYPFMGGFLDDIKSGSLSVFDTSVFAGTSIFASLYYIPFDFFTVIALLLSYVMNNETAYAISNLLRPVVGSLILYYALVRQGKKTKTAFFTSLIFFSCGLPQCYFVFPVYLGILVYVPLGILIVDLFYSNYKYFYLLPIYALTVVLYDFYLAYMILAFFMFYALIRGHISNRYSIFGKNTFIKNKKFYGDILGSLFLIILGVMMGAFIMLPSLDYMLNQTARSTSLFDIFTEYKDRKYELFFYEIKHYFTIFTTLFTPNEAHHLMLIPAGGYIREHVSMFMTVTGLFFFIQFFFLKGKENNRLKGWILFLNVIMIFPIVSMILSANSWPYIRWFFIVYVFNLLAMAKAMDETDLMVKNKVGRYIGLLVLALGLGTLIYVISGNVDFVINKGNRSENFIKILGYKYYFSYNSDLAKYIAKIPLFLHYATTEYLFDLVLGIGIGSIIVVMGITMFVRRDKPQRLIMPILISIECFLSISFILGYSAASSNDYYNNVNNIENVKNNFASLANYSDKNGYRITYDNGATKGMSNSQSAAKNVGFASYFHSFYNDELNIFINDVMHDCNTSGWSKRINGLYSFIAAPVFNSKYYAVRGGETVDMSPCYTNLNGNEVTFTANSDYWINTFYFANTSNSTNVSINVPVSGENVKNPLIFADKSYNYYKIGSLENTYYYNTNTNSLSSPSVPANYDGVMYTEIYPISAEDKINMPGKDYGVKTFLKTGNKDLRVSRVSYETSTDLSKITYYTNNSGAVLDFNSNLPTQGASLAYSTNGFSYSYFNYPEIQYYELADLPAFTVYDKYTDELSDDVVKNLASINYYAYVKSDSKNYSTIKDAAIPKVTSTEINSTLASYNISSSAFTGVKTKDANGNDNSHYEIDLSTMDLSGKNMLYVELRNTLTLSSATENPAFEDMYVVDNNGIIHGMGYGSLFFENYTPKKLYVKHDNSTSNQVKVYAYNTKGYTDYVTSQNQYTNRSYSLDGNEMKISFDMIPSSTSKIIKTAYTYSDEWKSNNSNYQVININGGMLGIIVPANTSSVDITLTFNPTYLKEGSILTGLGILLFAGLCCGAFIISKRKKSNQQKIIQ